MNYIKDLLNIYFLFAKIGSVTFGGGMAMLPILERELVDKRHWTEPEELLDFYAVSQSTPGIIAVNVATYIGYKRLGFLGGVIATIGVITPSIVIISILAAFIGSIDKILWVKSALKGINIAVAANLTYGTIGFAKKAVKNALGVFLFLAAFFVIFIFNISTVWIIFAATAIGLCQHFYVNRPSVQKSAEKEVDAGDLKNPSNGGKK